MSSDLAETRFFWLQTAKLSLLPAALVHTLLGIALAIYGQAEASIVPLVLVLLATSFLYLGGNFLNTWMDREADAIEHPSRPLPRGLISPLSYQLKAIRFLALGAIISALLSPLCFAVAVFIVAQIFLAQFRKSRPLASAIHYGFARASLVLFGFSALVPSLHSPLLSHSLLILGVHVLALALFATGQMLALRSRLHFLLICLPAPILAGFWWTEMSHSSRILALIAALPLLFYVRRIPRNPLLQREKLACAQALLEFSALPIIAWLLCQQSFAILLKQPWHLALAAAPLLAFGAAHFSRAKSA